MELKLSENIKSLRTKKGLTQKELAVALSVSPQAVSRWEKGQAYPDVLMLERLATFFGITIDTLVGRGAEYVEGLRRQLADLRRNNRGYSPAVALAECNIYEKLALAGQEQVRYYTALVNYKKREDRFEKGAVEEAALKERLDGARILAKEHLKNCPADRRMIELQHIFCIEDEERLEDWKEFVPSDFEHINYSDLLLVRYRTGQDDEKFEKELQHNTYRKVSALLYTLANGRCVKERGKRVVYSTRYGELHPVSYYKMMLNTLQVYSEKEWDLFLPQRTMILLKYAAALFRDGKEQEGFTVIEKLKKLMLHAEEQYVKGEEIKGSVPLLSKIQEETPLALFGQMMELVANEQHLPEFAPYKEDPRFASLVDLRKEIHKRVCIASLKKEEWSHFEKLLLEAQKVHLHHTAEGAKQPQALVMQCIDGKIYTYYYDYHDYDTEDETKLLNLIEKDRPLVKRLVSVWAGGRTDIPSHAVREKLIEIHPENSEAKMLLQGHYQYNVTPLSATMPPKKA